MIHGMNMRPSSFTNEENENVWKSSHFYTEKDFLSEYNKYLTALDHITECAKIFILQNWEKINNWSLLNVKIIDNSGIETEYFNYIPRDIKSSKSKTFGDILEKIDKRNKEKHNPIISITDVVLDTTDGDFSLTINGKPHLWINQEAIILIANYIESSLKNEQS